MMKKILNKKLLFILIGLFLATPVLAVNLVVEFEETPLFNSANFLPGDSVIRQIKVTNNSSETKPIITEAINFIGFPDPNNVPGDDLSRALNLVIRETGGSDLYNDTLFNFYDRGETYLSDIDPGSYKNYDFQIYFPKGLGDEWQTKTTNFDILIGFQGEGGGEIGGGGSNGGGGGIVRGLIIKEPLSVTPEIDSALIEWATNYNSTSQVVYVAEGESYSFDLNAPNYGYPHATTEDFTKVINHSVTLTGLIPGTTYHYRCISHGSFALSTEYSFTTLTEGESNLEGESNSEGESGESFEETSSQRSRSNKLITSILETEGDGGDKGSDEREESPFTSKSDEYHESDEFKNSFLASMADWFENKNLCWLLILLIAVLTLVFFLCIKKGKIEEKRICWLLPVLIIGLFILYCFYCPYRWTVGIIIAVVSLIVYIAIMLKA